MQTGIPCSERRTVPRVLLLLLVAATASTAMAQRVPEQLLACARETDDLRRLACFDREIAVVSKGDSVVHTEQYGLKRDSADKPQVLEARVLSVQERAQGQLVIELDNSQVWLKTDPDTRLAVSPGALVRIRPGVLGSFFMQPQSGGGARVKRLR